ncbi:MAG TPA: carbohydrate ABC transporter permease [Acidimicrobiia bacterium]|nr:carbohydrate ABC transporter permease [Acidimicrobiia bacterium]
MATTLTPPSLATSGRSGKRPPNRPKPRHRGWLITGVTALVLFVFLLPLGYMAVTSIKSEQQIGNIGGPILPKSPASIEYEGRSLDVFTVPLPDGSERELAMLQPGRQVSQFIDPADPSAGPIEWEGNWRHLVPGYELDPQWQNFSRAWDLMDFPILLRNTVIIAGVGTVGAVISSIVVAYGLSRFHVPFAKTIMVVLIATIVLPGFVTLVPKYAVFVQIGWVGTMLPLIVPHFFANAFNVFLLRQYFLTIPMELDEAATIDGAGPIRTLWSVVLPQMKAAIVAVSLFHFYFAWNDFFEPMIYLSTRRDLQPISVGLRTFNTLYDSQPNLIQSGALLALIIPVFVFLFAQRVFLQGIDLSGVQK